MPKPNGDGTLICVYDAWNRMVEVVGTARYRYDGRNFRIEKSVGQVSTKSFFCSEWQELESRTGTETPTYVWGLRYIDDLVCRNRGNEKLYSLAAPNWNVGALANAQGEVQERFTYDTAAGFVRRV